MASAELFQERGYARTTVEEIAAHAGLTERTFFRYFTDKREVLFSGSKELEKSLVETIASAPEQTASLEVVLAAFAAAGATLQSSREFSYVCARHALLAKHAELRERELTKLASLATVVAKALHARGVAEPEASMVAEVGVAAFKVGFERWVSGKKPRDLVALIRQAMHAVVDVAAASSTPPSIVGVAKPKVSKRAQPK